MAGMCNVYEEEVGKVRKEGKGRYTWEGLKGRGWGTEGGGDLRPGEEMLINRGW